MLSLGIDPQEVERSVRAAFALMAKQLQKQLRIATERYAGEEAARIRSESGRRPVPAHELVLDAAIKIDALVHCIWPELRALQTPKSEQQLSKFCPAVAHQLQSVAGIIQGELHTDRDRAIAKSEFAVGPASLNGALKKLQLKKFVTVAQVANSHISRLRR